MIKYISDKLAILYFIAYSVILYIGIPYFVSSRNLPKLIEKFQKRKYRARDLQGAFHVLYPVEKTLYFLKRRLKIKKNYCFRKSLVLLYWLRKFHIMAVLNIGLKFKDERKTYGHCWLTLDHKVIFEKSDRYQQYNTLLGKKDCINYWTSS